MSEYYKTDKYVVVDEDNALGEDGKYGKKGYAVINIETGITEHTTMMLPGAIFQAQHFNDTLESLLAENKEPVLGLVEDILPEGTDLN